MSWNPLKSTSGSSTGSEQSFPFLPESSKDASENDATKVRALRRLQQERYDTWKNAQEKMTSPLTPTGASAVSSTTSGIGASLGGALYHPAAGNWPMSTNLFDEIFKMSEEQKQIQQIISKLQAQAAQQQAEEFARLRRMKKADVARAALDELTKIRERLDTISAALATVCLEPEESAKTASV